MTNIFVNGDELTSKKEFDRKVNVTNTLFTLKHSPYSANDLMNSMGTQTMAVIHNQFSATQNGLGNYDSLFVFGGDDVKHMLKVDTFDHQIQVATTFGSNYWQEDLVLKSDYDKLVSRVSALENKIGGVLTRLYTKLRGTFTSLEVA